ncbi:GDSL esterase/lipase LTL1-like [Fagus crenata]
MDRFLVSWLNVGLVVTLSFISTQSEARAFFVFGDSLVDNGNNDYLATTARADSYPYGIDYPTHRPTGRFSNGLNIPDIISKQIGSEPTLPYLSPLLHGERLLVGANFASAGIGILNDTGFQFLNIIRIYKQLMFFQQYQLRVTAHIGAEQTQQLVNKALVLITLGGNDFVNNYYLVPFSARSRQFSLPNYVVYLISEYRKILERSFSFKPTRFLVFSFTISTSAIFFTFFTIWVIKATPSFRQEIHLQFNKSSFNLGLRPITVQTFSENFSVTGEKDSILIDTQYRSLENTSGFGSISVLSGLQLQIEKDGPAVLVDGGGKSDGLDGNLTTMQESTAEALSEKIEVPKSERNKEKVVTVATSSEKTGVSIRAKRLYDLGARRVLVTGTGPLGCVPAELALRSRNGECSAELNRAAALYNPQLIQMINQLNSEIGSEVFVTANAFDMHMDFISNPQAFGFVTSKVACCGQGPYNGIGLCTALSNLCPNRDLYAFWDAFHPSERANRIVVQSIMTGSTEYMHPMNLSTIMALDSRV